MAALNFPNSPSVNDLHTENGVTFKWNGTIWKRVSSAYTDATNLYVTGIGTFAGNVSIGGTLTYEDVKNVDSVGIITARGAIDAQGYINLAQKIIHTGDADTSIEFPSNDTIKFETAGSERLRIDSSGHMGLGISPSDIDSIGRSLNIASSTGGAIYLQDTDSPTGKFAAISYNGGTAALQIHAHHGASYIDLGTNGTERVRITSSGGCHLGLPATTKDWDTHAIALTTNSATFACPATLTLFGGTGYGTANMAGGGIRFVGYYDSSNFTTFGHIAGVKENTTSGNYAGALTFHTRVNGGLGAERLRIDSNGYVGIKLTNPHSYYAKDLVVKCIDQGGITLKSSSTSDTQYLMFADGTSGNERYRGYIGYQHNTGSGGEHLQLAASGSMVLRVDSDGLKFNADTAAANALNDYEEGTVTFTPVNSGVSFSSSYKGRYTKIGELVTISGYIVVTSLTQSGATLNVQLPFTSATNGQGYYTRGVGATFSKNMNFPSNYHNMVAYVGGGENYMRFFMTRNTGGSADWHQMTHNNITSSSAIYFNVCYTTTS